MKGSRRQRIWPPGLVGVHAKRATTCPCVSDKRDDLAFPARGRIVGLVQLRQLQPVADLSQHGSVDVFDGDDDGCAGVARSKVTVRADGHRRDDCGSAAETLDDGGEAAGLQRIWRADDGNRAGWGAEMPAQEIENGRELYRPVDSGGTGGGASALIFDPDRKRPPPRPYRRRKKSPANSRRGAPPIADRIRGGWPPWRPASLQRCQLPAARAPHDR